MIEHSNYLHVQYFNWPILVVIALIGNYRPYKQDQIQRSVIATISQSCAQGDRAKAQRVREGERELELSINCEAMYLGSMYCFSAGLPLTAGTSSAVRNRTVVRPRMMAPEFNAGEEYIRQLSKQSQERRARPPNGNPAPLRDLNPGFDTPSRTTLSGVDDELAQLDAQMADLERKLSERRATAEAPLNPEQRLKLAELEEQLVTNMDDTPMPPEPQLLDNLAGDSASVERQLLEMQRALRTPSPPPSRDEVSDFGDFENIRDRIGRHVTPTPVAPAQAFAQPEPASAPMQTQPAVEGERMRMGLIEMKLEAERYASAIRKLHETHEQIMHSIMQKYLPGM